MTTEEKIAFLVKHGLIVDAVDLAAKAGNEFAKLLISVNAANVEHPDHEQWLKAARITLTK